MIDTRDTLLAIIERLCEICRCTHRRSLPFQVGTMIEVPAAAITIEDLLDHVDSVSVGLNDLTQYLLAADRDARRQYIYYMDLHAELADRFEFPDTAGEDLRATPKSNFAKKEGRKKPVETTWTPCTRIRSRNSWSSTDPILFPRRARLTTIHSSATYVELTQR